jgi:hypothetical protein
LQGEGGTYHLGFVNHFLCLKKLSILKDKQLMQRLIDKVTCCIILHNMVLEEPVPQEWPQYDEEDVAK